MVALRRVPGLEAPDGPKPVMLPRPLIAAVIDIARSEGPSYTDALINVVSYLLAHRPPNWRDTSALQRVASRRGAVASNFLAQVPAPPAL